MPTKPAETRGRTSVRSARKVRANIPARSLRKDGLPFGARVRRVAPVDERLDEAIVVVT